jgi:predicted nucleic acid-binding Zn ribbon protein
MASDVIALETEDEELRQAVANMQRAVDQMQQQLSLLELALLNTIRGQWDAAQHGPQSAEAALVARNPGLQGKVHAVPFDLVR